MILLEADPSPVYALKFSPDGARLVAGTKAGGLAFFEHLARIGESPPPLMTPVNGVDFSPSGDTLASATGLGWFARSASGNAAHPRTPSRSVTAVRFVTETLLAVGVGDRARAGAGQVELWDLATKKPREPKMTAPEGVRALACHVGKKRLAWSEWGRRVGVWDVESAGPVYIPLPHAPGEVALDAAGERVAAAVKWDALVFDAATRREQFALRGHKGTLAALLFTPDGAAWSPAAGTAWSSSGTRPRASRPRATTSASAASRAWPSAPTGCNWPPAARRGGSACSTRTNPRPRAELLP